MRTSKKTIQVHKCLGPQIYLLGSNKTPTNQPQKLKQLHSKHHTISKNGPILKTNSQTDHTGRCRPGSRTRPAPPACFAGRPATPGPQTQPNTVIVHRNNTILPSFQYLDLWNCPVPYIYHQPLHNIIQVIVYIYILHHPFSESSQWIDSFDTLFVKYS